MKGKVVVITGASSGIGAATARTLAALGARVVLGAGRKDRLDAIVDEIVGDGDVAAAFVCDVSKRRDVEAMVQGAIATFGRVDVIVNNAGIMPLSRLELLRVDEWDDMIDVNIKGALYGIAAVLPGFQKQGSGHVVNISSIAGFYVAPTAAVYCATKFAVRALTEAFRQEVAPMIRTTVISPGAVSTELADVITDPRSAAAMEGLMKLALPPEVIADAVAYAIGQPASVSVNEVLVRPTAHV